MKQIISFLGAPGAGKDVLADFLVENKGFIKIAFADEIKKQYFRISGYSNEEFKNARGLPLEEEIRKGLWDYSNKQKEKFGSDVFVDVVVDFIKDQSNNVVITDVRTKEELDAMLNIGSKICFVVRDFYSSKCNNVIPGTKIKISDVITMPVFFNYGNNLDLLKNDFFKFYNHLIRG